MVGGLFCNFKPTRCTADIQTARTPDSLIAPGTLLPPKSLSAGNSVEMLTGPFANFVATVDTIDPEQRIWVLMDFMGQITRMQVTADQLQIAK
jgi:hypothetical protein